MSTIATRLTMAIAHASFATAGTQGSPSTAVTQAHVTAEPPVLLLLLAVAFVMIVVRANFGLVRLVSQLVQLAVAVGRTLILLGLVAALAAALMLHL